MAPTYSPIPELGRTAPDFELPATDGKTYSLADFSDAKVLVVVFICNHCPYVVATQERINLLAKKFAPKGVQFVGINSNDATRYPDDSFEAMKERAEEVGYIFPYLHDESQIVARSFDAACTPDPFVFAKKGNSFILEYRGRIDDNWKDESAVTTRDLNDAIESLIQGKPVNTDQKPAMGCSIKWKQLH
ncbi:thioredoxin family protein [bacterium]|jgi:peroxiredoxin|nr:thioredoxin family protein [bacterium]